MSDTRETVRERYADAAKALETGASSEALESCCGPGGEVVFGGMLYGDDRSGLPQAAVVASLGCGNPTAVADLSPGESVLDLGSGGGIDVLLSAKRVGPSGMAYGLDMTAEMLELAERNKVEAGVDNARFLKGYIEEIPLPDCTVDVVISNCVINLSADKPKVFREIFRVLKPGGRIGISDVVASNDLSGEQRAERGSWVGCIAGALSFAEYERDLHVAGFEGIDITPSHEVTDEMFSAIVKARKPL